MEVTFLVALCIGHVAQSRFLKDSASCGQSHLLESKLTNIFEAGFRLLIWIISMGIGIQVLTLIMRWSDRNGSVVVTELISSSEQKMKSKILCLWVGSLTCWLRNNKLARSVNGLAIRQLMSGHDQSILGKLISPSIMMLGNGEGNGIM